MRNSYLAKLSEAVIALTTVRVACGHSYLASVLTSESIVLDLGANIGSFSRGLSESLGCLCYCVEPDRNNFDQIVTSPRIQKCLAAVGPADGNSCLLRSENAEAHSLFPSSYTATNADAGQQVRVASYCSLLREFGINTADLLKMDVEGAESAFLESMTDDELSAIGQITVEFHNFIPELQDWDRTWRIRMRLEFLGFRTIVDPSFGDMNVLFINQRKLKLGRRDWFCFGVFDWINRLKNWRHGLKRRLGRLHW